MNQIDHLYIPGHALSQYCRLIWLTLVYLDDQDVLFLRPLDFAALPPSSRSSFLTCTHPCTGIHVPASKWQGPS
uniref:Uncharacterized protein n=1 Tax=Arundo donax TaxID=35708 RepID=A0A0A9HFA5_ARUDO